MESGLNCKTNTTTTTNWPTITATTTTEIVYLLPGDILLENIALFFNNFFDFFNCALVCKKWNYYLRDHSRWEPPFLVRWKFYENGKDYSGNDKTVENCTFKIEPNSGHKALYVSKPIWPVVPRVNFRQTSFSFMVWVNLENVNSNQFIFADWVWAWQFIFQVDNGRFSGRLRRHINPSTPGFGSISNQDLVSAGGGRLSKHTWHCVAFTWDRIAKIATAYVDGKIVNTGTPDPTLTNMDLQYNTETHYQIGYKADSNSNYFEGYLRDLCIFPWCLSERYLMKVFEKGLV